MALVASALAQAIVDALKDIDDPSQAGPKFGKAVSDYIKDNAMVMYTWAGVNPSSGAPDPVTMIQPVVQAPTAPWSMPQGATVPAAAMAALGTALSSYLTTMMLDPSAAGFTLSPMNIIAVIVLSPSGADNQQDAMMTLAGDIIGGLSVTPAASGTHAAFTGAASGGSIS